MAQTPTGVVVDRMREIRKKRGWNAAQLAERMRGVGIDWNRSIVANLENGRRSSVSVAELLALALVLGVAPVHLLVPLEDDARVAVTPGREESARPVREWVCGVEPLPGTDLRQYFAEVPPFPVEAWEARNPKLSREDEVRRLAEMARQIGEAARALLAKSEDDDGRS